MSGPLDMITTETERYFTIYGQAPKPRQRVCPIGGDGWRSMSSPLQARERDLAAAYDAYMERRGLDMEDQAWFDASVSVAEDLWAED